MESDDPKDLILLVKGLRKENSVLRKRSQPGDSKHSFYENTELDEQEGIRDSEVDTINELEARITTLQRIVAQNREKLVEFEVVKRRLVALDSTMHTQRVLLERLTTENNSLRNTSAELRAENANLLEMYELELRRADLIRDLCIDLDEENKELHLSFQPHHQQSYGRTLDVSGDSMGSLSASPSSSSLPELPSRSNSAQPGSLHQGGQLQRRDRRILGQLTTRLCRNARRNDSETTPS